jgi:alpha-galactosidase/6-phospho-beta-glucosidase family protein
MMIVIETIDTTQPVCMNDNMHTHMLIDNLSVGRCMDVPCLVDSQRIRGAYTTGASLQIETFTNGARFLM